MKESLAEWGNKLWEKRKRIHIVCMLFWQHYFGV